MVQNQDNDDNDDDDDSMIGVNREFSKERREMDSAEDRGEERAAKTSKKRRKSIGGGE